jgi:hypothetical protein
MRGRLFLAGVDGQTPVSDVLDVLTVIVVDTPGEALGKWRSGLDRAAAVARADATRARGTVPSGGRPDRATWGLAPDQIAATERFMTTMGAR